MKRSALIVTFALLAVTSLRAQERRPMSVDDIFELKTVGDPRISPDGQWVAYTVSQMNSEEDNADTDIYMVSLDGEDTLQLTSGPKSENSSRWSPDGRYLAFMSGREGDSNQVWLLDRRGGEAKRLTDIKPGVSGFTWSPDGTRLALIIRDEDPDAGEDEGEEGASEPIVIRRLQFKRDGQGYLDEHRRHIYVFDIEEKKATQITDGPYDDSNPVWSPDGGMGGIRQQPHRGAGFQRQQRHLHRACGPRPDAARPDHITGHRFITRVQPRRSVHRLHCGRSPRRYLVRGQPPGRGLGGRLVPQGVDARTGSKRARPAVRPFGATGSTFCWRTAGTTISHACRSVAVMSNGSSTAS